MNAVFMALLLTAAIFLEHILELYARNPSNGDRAKKLKVAGILVVLVIGWTQAAIQYYREAQSDNDTKFLKEQLALANASLTNVTATARGLSDGGDSYLVPSLGLSDKSNALGLYLWQEGEFPQRGVSIKARNETKRIQAELAQASVIPDGEPVFEKYLGDLPNLHLYHLPPLCDLPLDPSTTNYYRLDIQAKNGFSWELVKIYKATNGWATALHYRHRRFGEFKSVIEPTNWGNAMLIY